MNPDEKVPKKVYDYLVSAEVRICDDCLKQALALSTKSQASQATSAFGVTPLFKRGSDICQQCEKRKTVIASI